MWYFFLGPFLAEMQAVLEAVLEETQVNEYTKSHIAKCKP
jgi:hypothetical protein